MAILPYKPQAGCDGMTTTRRKHPSVAIFTAPALGGQRLGVAPNRVRVINGSAINPNRGLDRVATKDAQRRGGGCASGLVGLGGFAFGVRALAGLGVG